MIHPYYDGNGRTGRVLNLMYLKLSDKLDTPILYLSKYIIENRSEYYNLLNKTGKSKKDILEFIIYMLKAIEKTSKYTLTLIDNIIDAMNNTKNEYIRTKLNISRQTATSYLKQLEEVGILSSEKIGKEIIYKNISLFKIAEN
nr:Fic family protein [Fusobacterium nucleatum]